MFLQQLVNGLTLGSLYAVLAIGLTLVFSLKVWHYCFGALKLDHSHQTILVA